MTAEEWKEFKETEGYQTLEKDYKERYEIVLTELKIGNSSMGSDERLRGRLSELEFVLGMPDAYIEEAELIDAQKKSLSDDDKEN